MKKFSIGTAVVKFAVCNILHCISLNVPAWENAYIVHRTSDITFGN